MARYAADLHIHTAYSDGTFSPRKLVKQAKTCGLTTIAVTDHDSIDGVTDARRAGDKLGINVIPGVELSAHHEGIEVHILGLFIELVDPRFLELLQRLQKMRVDRVYAICDRLKHNCGVELSPDDVLSACGKGTPSRAHIAQALVNKGIASDFRETFSKYIGDHSPGCVGKQFLSMSQAIEAIRRAHGCPVFAHPGLTRHDELLPLFARMGGLAIESYYPPYTRRQTRHYLQMCEDLNLLPSGGSDCHGKNRQWLLMGRIRLPEHIVDALGQAARIGHVKQ